MRLSAATVFFALVTACCASPALLATTKTTSTTAKTTSTSTTTAKTTTTSTSTTTAKTTTTTTTATKTTTTTVTTTPTTPISVPTPTAGAPPPNFNITSLGVNGSGCPPGSAFFLLSDDHTAVTITFSQFQASAGPGIAITENRKNCQSTLNIHVPQGFSFAIVDVDYRGYYQLDKGVNALHDASYYFQGQLAQSEATSTLSGPLNGGNYVYRDEFNLSPTIYSPCGQDTVLNVNTAVRVDNSGNSAGSGFITNDSIDVSVKQTFNFQWLTC